MCGIDGQSTKIQCKTASGSSFLHSDAHFSIDDYEFYHYDKYTCVCSDYGKAYHFQVSLTYCNNIYNPNSVMSVAVVNVNIFL